MKQRWAVLVFTFSVSSGTVAQAGTHVAYAVESGRSCSQISGNKGGLCKVLGHEHLLSANQVCGRDLFNDEMLEGSSVDLYGSSSFTQRTGGGSVRVKNRVWIRFDVVAEK